MTNPSEFYTSFFFLKCDKWIFKRTFIVSFHAKAPYAVAPMTVLLLSLQYTSTVFIYFLIMHLNS